MSSSHAMNWVASGLETYLAGLHEGTEPGTPQNPVDYLIVGSGYGGALSAAEISKRSDASVYLFERGAEFLPGMFPANTAELIGHIRLCKPGGKGPAGNPEGLFDVHADGDVSTVCANGLGGGSLINAGVMRKPVAAVFDQPRWPNGITLESLKPYYRDAEALLGSRRKGKANIYSKNSCGHTASKAQFLEQHALRRHGYDFDEAELTISLQDGPNQADVFQQRCIACGDCATGCNHNAKNSLDTNLLQQAKRQGANLFTGATVLKTERGTDDDGQPCWIVHIAYSNRDMRLRDPGYRPPQLADRVRANVNTVYCKNLLLCAGTLGSTEILKRSVSSTLKFSSMLGDHFSTNGDMLAFCDTEDLDEKSGIKRPLSVADPQIPPAERKIGPTICAVVSPSSPEPVSSGVPDLLIEEMAVPAPLQPFVGAGTAMVRTIRQLASTDTSHHRYGDDPARESADGTHYTGVYAIMGDDGAGGSLELETFEQQAVSEQPSDGYLRVRFAKAGKHELFKRQMRALRKLLNPRPASLYQTISRLWNPDNHDSSPVFATPGWQLPGFAGRALGENNPHQVVTVHPLGGCVMGEQVKTGVVNEFGAVFDAAEPTPHSVHDGLYVLDGAIIPTALATNPALTISALTLRALCHPESSLKTRINQTPRTATPNEQALQHRPTFSDKAFMGNEPTTFDVIERMKGRVAFFHQPADSDQPVSVDKIVEVTLRMGPIDARALYVQDDNSSSVIPVNQTIENKTGVISQIRIFDPQTYTRAINRYNNGYPLRREELKHKHFGERFRQIINHQTHLDQYLANCAQVTILVSGTLDVFHRETSSPRQRVTRLIRNNYGPKSLARFFAKMLYAGATSIFSGHRPANAIPYLSAAVHSADTRYMTYRLNTEHFFIDDQAEQLPGELVEALQRGDRRVLHGRKEIDDHKHKNLWRQLSQMAISDMPGHDPENKAPLSLDLDLLAQLRVPLMRVAKQDQMINTKLALIGLSGYLLRMLLPLQYSNFLSYINAPNRKKKATATTRVPQRFPGNVNGLPDAEIVWQPVIDRIPDDRVAALPAGTPVRIRLTRYRRTSSKFPVLLLHGYSASGTTFTHKTLNVPFAKMLHDHGYDVWVLDMRTSCAMDSALYPWSFEDVAAADIPEAIKHIVSVTGFEKINVVAHCMGSAMFSMSILGRWDRHPDLHQHINSAVLSQVPPVIRLREAGRFRAFLSNYLKTFLPQTEYQLQASAKPDFRENIADFILSTLPYPDSEQTVEQLRAYRDVDYQRTRRRLDLLYTRTFHIENVSPETLDHIDDLFGPLNLQTISQSIHFARQGWVTDRLGKDLQPPDTIAQTMERQWTFPTYAFIGKENSLFEPGALREFEQIFHRQDMQSTLTIAEPIDNYGHQDVFMANDAKEKVFDNLVDWLDRHQSAPATTDRTEKPTSHPVCYRIKGILQREPQQLTIRINQQDLHDARMFRKPTRLGVWIDTDIPILESFFLEDYAADCNAADSWMVVVDAGPMTLDENDDFVLVIHAQDHPALFGDSALHFFFESEYPIHRSSEITPLPAHDARTVT